MIKLSYFFVNLVENHKGVTLIRENHSLEEALILYIQLLNNEQFFDAHEVLEEAWHPLRRAKDPLRNLLKGLINASIAFEHIKRNREESKRKATTVFSSYIRYKPLCVKGIKHEKLFFQAIKKVEILKLIYLNFIDIQPHHTQHDV